MREAGGRRQEARGGVACAWTWTQRWVQPQGCLEAPTRGSHSGASVGTAQRGLPKGPTDYFLLPQPPRACYAQAQFDFSTQDPSQLSFRRGDIIEVLERLDPCWWRGRLCGRVGFFPRSYVQPVHL